MGLKLSELEEGVSLYFHVSNETGELDFDGALEKHIKENIALVSLNLPTTKPISFDTVRVNMEYHSDAVPVIWRDVKLVPYKTEYVLQVFSEGMNNNRRSSFRVGVSEMASLRRSGHGAEQVMVKDVSLSGFALTDRKKEFGFKMGERISIYFEDLGHILDLAGQLVRIEEHDDMIIYGFEICNLCKDLSSYITVKQRLKR